MADALIKIPVELFAVAESSHFEGELDWPSMTTGLDDLAFEGPVTWAVDVLNTEGALLVTGSAQAHAKTTCARCLGDAEIDLDGEIEGWFLLSEESAMPEDVDEDVDVDDTMEEFMDDVLDVCDNLEGWYFGHFHDDLTVGGIGRLVYRDVVRVA